MKFERDIILRAIPRSGPFSWVALAALSLAACGGGGAAPGDGGAIITYERDVRPIVEEKCLGCHVEGGIAPFALGSYAQARGALGQIGEVVQTRTMPPWPAGQGCTEYQHDRSLSDAQIATITQWVAGGGVQGAPGDGPPPRQAPQSHLSRVDRTIRIPQPYTPAASPDEYRCFLLDWPETTVKYVTGLRVNPGAAEMVHHAVITVEPPANLAKVQAADDRDPGLGWNCFSRSPIGALSVWTPGNLGVDAPAGTGIRIVPGSKIVMQIHYNTLVAQTADQTSLDFKLDDQVTKEAVVIPFTNVDWGTKRTMKIPAGSPDTSYEYALDLSSVIEFVSGGVIKISKPIVLYDAMLHMHQRGAKGRLEVIKADGTRDCLVDVPRWDFHWQYAYQFAKPRTIVSGDKLYLRCQWDNTAAKQPVINGQRLTPQDLYWGEGSEDEMCFGFYYATQGD